MHSNRRYILILLVLASLLMTSLACNLPINLLHKPLTDSLPSQVIPTGTSTLTIILTEAQLNSLVAQSLQSQPQQNITNAVVNVRNGKIQIKGNVLQNNLSLPLTLNLSVTADGQGGIQYQILSAYIGPFPLSQDQVDQISSQLSSALDEQIQQVTNQMYIETIAIGDGFITVTGRAR